MTAITKIKLPAAPEMRARAPATDPPQALAALRAVGQLAMQRHAEARARQPERAATAYLRAALTCARTLARLARRQPELLPHAHALLSAIIAAAQTAEAELAAAGRNSAPYLTLLIAATGLRLAWHLTSASAADPPAADPPAVTPRPFSAPPPAMPARTVPVRVAPPPRPPKYKRKHDRFVRLQTTTP